MSTSYYKEIEHCVPKSISRAFFMEESQKDKIAFSIGQEEEMNLSLLSDSMENNYQTNYMLTGPMIKVAIIAALYRKESKEENCFDRDKLNTDLLAKIAKSVHASDSSLNGFKEGIFTQEDEIESKREQINAAKEEGATQFFLSIQQNGHHTMSVLDLHNNKLNHYNSMSGSSGEEFSKDLAGILGYEYNHHQYDQQYSSSCGLSAAHNAVCSAKKAARDITTDKADFYKKMGKDMVDLIKAAGSDEQITKILQIHEIVQYNKTTSNVSEKVVPVISQNDWDTVQNTEYYAKFVQEVQDFGVHSFEEYCQTQGILV